MTLTLRPATEADARLLFNWRNDDETRRSSLNREPVAWSDHVRWLAASLQRPDRRLMVAEMNGEPVGTVRLDRAAGQSELSWTVAPAHRGRGLGKAMVAQALAETEAAVVIASIRADNIASLRIAESCGFRRVAEQDGIALYRRG
jgi:RimJ/RimL family protein N-acetyltransferase